MALQLSNGDTLRFHCVFTHEGVAYNQANLYVALGVTGIGFLEKLWAWVPIGGIGDDPEPTQYQLDVDLPIQSIGTFNFAAGPGYELYAKIMQTPHGDVFWFSDPDVIELLGDVGDAVFANFNVTYAKV